MTRKQKKWRGISKNKVAKQSHKNPKNGEKQFTKKKLMKNLTIFKKLRHNNSQTKMWRTFQKNAFFLMGK